MLCGLPMITVNVCRSVVKRSSMVCSAFGKFCWFRVHARNSLFTIFRNECCIRYRCHSMFSSTEETMTSLEKELAFEGYENENVGEKGVKVDTTTCNVTQEALQKCSSSTPVQVTKFESPTASPSQVQQSTLSARAKKKLLRYERIKAMKKKNKHNPDDNTEVGFGNEIFAETDYYFENGLRKVYPYYYTFSTYVKRRWIGLSVLEVFSKEFCADDGANYKQIIEEGRLTVNGEKVNPDRRLKDNELLCHRVHRHENPVLGGAIEVIADTEDVVVINKPASVPCHPCGRYRHNSVVFIVGKELGYYNLRNIYRLDRLTSGVLILGKTDSKSKELEKQVANRQVQKTYVARVQGCFPPEEVELDQPLACASPKLGLWRVDPQGKPSHTTFRRLSYNGHSSVVQCIPHTGRTHQIRVHLQYLGHPIVNDPFYNSDAWGINKGRGGKYGQTLTEVIEKLMEKHNPRHWEIGENPMYYERLAEMSAPRKEPLTGTFSPCKSDGSPDSEDCGSQPSGSGTGNGVSRNRPCEDPTLGACSSSPAVEAVCLDPFSQGGENVAHKSCETDGKLACFDLNLKLRMDAIPSADSQHTAEPPRKQRKLKSDQPLTSFASFQPSKWIPDKECDRCRILFRDPKPSELILYLHALSYQGPGWKYDAPLPDWAREDWAE